MKVTITLVTALFFLFQSIFSQTKIAQDTELRTGILDNGLTYYIKKNAKPEERVMLRLVVKAGSLQEDDDQQGLAHFLEHMCFNGTKHFEKTELVNFLEKMGINFGPDLNAFTSFVTTVYMLQVPTDKEGLLDTAFMVLEDWASSVSLEDEEINKERGVIIEEWRLGLGAYDRMMKKWLPEVFKNTRYAERVPIGKIDIIKNFHHDRIRDFYRDWYRPDLMGVIVVGDVDPDSIENIIKTRFGKLKNPVPSRDRIKYSVMNNTHENSVVIATDKEALYNDFFILFEKEPQVPVLTEEDFMTEIMIPELTNEIFRNRLREKQLDPGSPFVSLSSSYSDLMWSGVQLFELSSRTKEGRMKEALEQVFIERKKALDHGFTDTELERAKVDILERYYRGAKEMDKTHSSYFIDTYFKHFIAEKPIISLTEKEKIVKKFIDKITVSDINNTFSRWVKNDEITVVVLAPEKEDNIIPSDSEILSIIENTKQITTEKYVDDVPDQALTENVVSKAKVSSVVKDEKVGFTTVTLSNGIEFVLKTTDFKNDQVLFSCISKGGHSLYPDQDYFSARYLSTYINSSGLGDFSLQQLEKKLAGKNANVNFWLTDISEGFTGGSSRKDIETMFQLLYLYFTAPRADTSAFKLLINREREKNKNLFNYPQNVFYDTLQKLINCNDIRALPFLNEEQISQVSLERMMEIYKERTSNAADFRYYLVGSFDIDSVIQHITRYVGSLPANSKLQENFTCLPTCFPDTTTRREIHRGIEEQSFVAIQFYDTTTWHPGKRLQVDMLSKILSIRFRENLREEQGGVYRISARPDVKIYPFNEFYLQVSFGCNPERADSLTQLVIDEMKKLMDEGPTQLDLDKVKAQLIRSREVQIKENNFWLYYLRDTRFYNTEMLSFEDFQSKLEQVTVTDIQTIARELFSIDKYVQVILKPENK